MIGDSAALAIHRERAESFRASAQRFREIGAHDAAEIAIAAARDEEQIVEGLLLKAHRGQHEHH
jgi:hypothetical protein